MKTSLFKTTLFGFAILSFFLSCHWGWDLERCDPCPTLVSQTQLEGVYGTLIEVKGKGFVKGIDSLYKILIDGQAQTPTDVEVLDETTLRFRIAPGMKSGKLSVRLTDAYCDDEVGNLPGFYYRYDPVATAAAMDTFAGHRAPCTACMKDPRGLEVDADGNVWVADAFGERILEFDAGGNLILPKYGVPGKCSQSKVFADVAHFERPMDLCIDASKVIYVAERNSFVVRKISGGQAFTIAGICGTSTATPSDGSCKELLMGPGNIAQYGNYLYLVDNDAVRRLDEANCTLKTLLYDKGTLNPTAIAVGDKRKGGPVFVGVDNTIVAIDENGHVATLPMTIDGSRFQRCTALAMDGNGNLFIADNGQGQIYVLYTDGALRPFLSVPSPSGLALDTRNGVLTLYVAKTDGNDSLGNLILKYPLK